MPFLTDESRWTSYIKLSKLKKKKTLVHRVPRVMSVMLRNTHQAIPGQKGVSGQKGTPSLPSNTQM